MRLSLIACAALALAACKTTPLPPASPPVAQAAVPADDNLNAVLWVQTTAEYRAIAEQAYRSAADRLDVALKHKDWDALAPGERDNPVAGLKPAVVLDIDETVLDNSPYQARLVREGGRFDRDSWDRWVNERKARPVPGAVEFARAANARGVTLLYVSNRTMAQKEATLANLKAMDLPAPDDSVYLGADMAVPGCEPASRGDKHCRRQWVGRSYRVLMQFGDQLGDFAEPKDDSRAAHAALFDRYRAWFGERWFMLPNPTYGAWETRYKDPDRATAKRDALDVAP